jgi:prepilin-type processing-associated H-X9-DG protein
MTSTTRGRGGASLVEVLVACAIVTVMIGLLLPAVERMRVAAGRLACANNLRQITTGLLAYESQFGKLPIIGRGQADDWALALLPFIDQADLARLFNRALSPTDPANAAAATRRPPIYRCPARDDVPTFLESVPGLHYGMNACLASRRMVDVSQSHLTLLVGELPLGVDFPWVVSPAIAVPDIETVHGDGANLGFAGGHVSWVRATGWATIILDPDKPSANNP